MNTKRIRRIGVLTGGGDCPGLNAVIRAIVKRATYEFGWEVIGIRDGFEGLILPAHTQPLGLNEVRGILPRGGTILGTSNRANPFSYQEAKQGVPKQPQDMSKHVCQRVEELGLDAIVVIGGDGSLHISMAFLKEGVPIVGVPKTIDNDICLTDVTFGFDTALQTATDALDKLHTTAESHHRIVILEVMGRDVGWLALGSGMAGGADVILIPEIQFSLEAIDAKIISREREGAKFSIAVVAEGAHAAGKDPIYQQTHDPTAPKRLGGIAHWVGTQIETVLDREVRVTVLGHIQRGGSPSAFDRKLSTLFGSEVLDLVAERRFGQMVALQGERIAAVPIKDAVRELKRVPLDHPQVRAARALGLCLGDA